MKRAILIGFITLYNYFITILCSGLSITTTGGDIIDTPTTIGILSIIPNIKLFANLLAFNIEGIPFVLVFIFIYIPNIILFWVLITLAFNRN